MAGPDRARHDVNLNPTITGVSILDGETPVSIWADPTTHSLLTTGAGGGGSTQYTSGAVTPSNPIGTISAFDNNGVIATVSANNPLPATDVALQNITDQLAHLVNSLKFLSALQTPNSELRVSLFGAGINNLTQYTLGAVASVTNQVSLGGYQETMAVMNQVNTNANQLRQQIITT